ncbi:hypothetical protein Ocin01_06818 [Orchesella cincta]|uniref:Uncharacterized protein n=1 Tax=Orchesella cincta TaxID=48709 RepID=A0A1D2N3R3_ORCCI|nr:hypothetical protein Ocin01_06818 [Orchesella cincta]
MGNNVSGEHVLCWSSSSSLLFSYASLYCVKDPQIVTIKGQALSCIVDVSNATIIINDDDHLVTIVGNNNKITVNGSGIKLRVEGDDNKVGGPGKKLLIYADSEKVTVKMFELDGANQIKLTDNEGNIVADAPEPLELPASMTGENWQRCIRYAYTNVNSDDGSQSENTEATEDSDTDTEDSEESTDSEDDDDDFSDDEDKVDDKKPNDKESSTRKRNAEEDAQNKSQNKKLKGETPKKINRRKK